MARERKTQDITAIVSIIAGLIIIAVPQILGWVIGLYLLVSGILSLIDKNKR